MSQFTNMNLVKVDVSKNYLDNIDALSQLYNLTTILAGDNYIQSVNLCLPSLSELDLRNNFITNIPDMTRIPQLKTLVLNANNITEVKLKCRKENFINLQKVVLRNNKI